MEKKKIAVIFGGMSTEHDVSIVSGMSVIKNLNNEKYEIFPIYISKNGTFYKLKESLEEFKERVLKVGEEIKENSFLKLDNVIDYLKNMDCIFPVLHGLYGEDGTIQGLFELLKVPYVGCRVLASSVAMDKVYTKIIFEKAGLNQVKYVYVKGLTDGFIFVNDDFSEEKLSLDEVVLKIEEKIKYPMFIKPSNSGSSVGINKAKNKEELKNAILVAKKYDTKILVEEGIVGREVECAVLGNEDVIASCVGEILPADEFYSYDAKYNNEESKTIIPVDIEENIVEEIRKSAIKAFKAIDGKGLSRVDFFIENNTNKVIINEINTLPGFTNISMYPKLFENVGISYDELLDKLIELAMKK